MPAKPRTARSSSNTWSRPLTLLPVLPMRLMSNVYQRLKLAYPRAMPPFPPLRPAPVRQDAPGSSVRTICDVKSYVEIGESARKHGILDADIEHAMEHAMKFMGQDDERLLYLGSSRSEALLEVVKVLGKELVIHAMLARLRYVRMLPGCEA